MDWRSVGRGTLQASILLVAGLILLVIGLFVSGWVLLGGVIFLVAAAWAYVASRRQRL